MNENGLQPVLILADDDRHKESNGGVRSAEMALKEVDVGRVALPAWTPEERGNKGCTDFADVARSRGLRPVRRQVECEVGKLRAKWLEWRREREQEREPRGLNGQRGTAAQGRGGR